ncbi:hypothetical protein [Kribbella sp. NPDC004536]|uniref:hypothetical protein n=1 Tax=Kribbella sp. NPDC004536 TaxID=3364106 RepID=UPI00369B6E92
MSLLRKVAGRFGQRFGIAVGLLAMALTGATSPAQAASDVVTSTWGGLGVTITNDHRTDPETTTVTLNMSGFVTINNPQFWINDGKHLSWSCSGYDKNHSIVSLGHSAIMSNSSNPPLVAYEPGGGIIANASFTEPLGGRFNVNVTGPDEIWCVIYAYEFPGAFPAKYAYTNHVVGNF